MNKRIRNVLTIGTMAAMAYALASCSAAPAETSAGVENPSVAETSAAAVETSQAEAETVATAQAVESETALEVVEIDGDLQLYANTFITGFVEQYFPDYDRETSGIEQILDYIHINLKLNSYDSISYENAGDITYETFTEEDVQRMAVQVFGRLVTDELSELPAPPESYGDQPAGPYYADGKVWYEAADGETYNRIGIVDSILNPGDGTLVMEFSVYTIDIDRYWSLTLDELRGLYALTPEQADADSLLTQTSSGTATVGVMQSGEYYLINYSVDN